MKVLLINAFYGAGSTGTIVKDIEELCLKNGIECYVASPDLKVKTAKNGILIGNYLDHKIHAVLCRILGKQSYYSQKATNCFLDVIKNIKPDIVHLHNIHSNFINQELLFDYLASNDIPTMLTLHDCWFYTGGCFHYTTSNCYKWQNECGDCPQRYSSTPSLRFRDYTRSVLNDKARLYSNFTKLMSVGVSSWISREAEKSILKNSIIATIHNGIDKEVFKPRHTDVLRKMGLEDKFVILGPASKWLLSANEEVLKYFCDNMKDDEVLLLFGSKSHKRINHHKVFYCDFISSKEKLSEIYSAASVFVNCSREDSLSLINIEAQACGTPVVTFDITGLSETVDNNSSFSVPVGNYQLLYEKVSFIREKNVKQRNDCRRYVLKHFQKDINYQKYIDYYKQLCRKDDAV